MTVFTASGLGIEPGGDVTAAVQSAFDELQPGDSFVFDGAGRYTVSRASAELSHGLLLDGPTDITITVAEGAELYTAESLASLPFNLLHIKNPLRVRITGSGAMRAVFAGTPASRIEGRLVFFDGTTSDLRDCEIDGLCLRVTHSTNAVNAALYGVLAVGNVSSGSSPRGDGFHAHGLTIESGSVGRSIQVRRVDNSVIEDNVFDGIGGALGTIGIRPQGDMAGLIIRRNNIRISGAASITTEGVQIRPGTPAYGPLEAPEIHDNIITGSCSSTSQPAIAMKIGASTDAVVRNNLILADPSASAGVRAFQLAISDTEPDYDVRGLVIRNNAIVSAASSYNVSVPEGGGEYVGIRYERNLVASIPNYDSSTTYRDNLLTSQRVVAELPTCTVLAYEAQDQVVRVLGQRVVALPYSTLLLRKLTATVADGVVTVYSDDVAVESFEPGYTAGATHAVAVLPPLSCAAVPSL